MPTDPAQLFLTVFELCLLAGGAGLLLWLLFNPEQRRRWLSTRSLPQLALTPLEFALGAVIIFITGIAFNGAVQSLLGARIGDDLGLKILVFGVANYTGSLVGWRLLVPHFLRIGQIGPNLPTGRSSRPVLSWSEVTGYALGTVLVALPILSAISFGWLQLLRALGLPDDPQDLVALFAQMKSPWIVAGLLVTACVLAPIHEELIFRAGIYRYARQKIGRTPALLLSAVGFGALHANWASFVPLAVLGMLFAIVYEATGSIRVVIVAHGLFNLNTILIILSGLQPAAS